MTWEKEWRQEMKREMNAMSNQPPLSPAPVSPFSHQFLPSLHIIRDNRELKQRRPRRQRARQKSNRFITQNDNFVRASCFSVDFVAVTAQPRRDVKMPNFTLYGGRKQAPTNLSLSFKLEYGPQRNQLWGNSPSFGIFSELE